MLPAYTWYSVLGTMYLVPIVWYRVHLHFVPGTWYQVLGTKCLVSSTWHQLLGSSTRHQSLSTNSHLEPNTYAKYQQPGTCSKYQKPNTPVPFDWYWYWYLATSTWYQGIGTNGLIPLGGKYGKPFVEYTASRRNNLGRRTSLAYCRRGAWGRPRRVR